MENKNFTLKEKEINRDYYLKRAIIYSLITAIGTPYARFIGGTVSFFIKVGDLFEDAGYLRETLFAWSLGNVISLTIWLIFIGLTIYYTTKSWKAYKACQEENNQ